MVHPTDLEQLIIKIKQYEIDNQKYLGRFPPEFVNLVTDNEYVINVQMEFETLMMFVLKGYSPDVIDSVWNYILTTISEKADKEYFDKLIKLVNHEYHQTSYIGSDEEDSE